MQTLVVAFGFEPGTHIHRALELAEEQGADLIVFNDELIGVHSGCQLEGPGLEGQLHSEMQEKEA